MVSSDTLLVLNMTEETYREHVRKQAEELWLIEDKPDGKADEHWHRAEELVDFNLNTISEQLFNIAHRTNARFSEVRKYFVGQPYTTMEDDPSVEPGGQQTTATGGGFLGEDGPTVRVPLSWDMPFTIGPAIGNVAALERISFAVDPGEPNRGGDGFR